MKDLSMYGDINKYPCSLVMSGVESDAYFDIAIGEGIDRMLMSYHYIQRKGKNFLRDRLSKHPHVKMMIDSGAHTFHAKEDEFKNKPLEFWEKYLERYTNFVKANKEFIFSCVELDIANLVGFDKVDYFRQKYFEPLKEEGILVCYVWHDYDGDKHWEEMCAKYDYVGFSLVNTSMTENEIVRKMNIARRYGTLVHGFAVTRVDIMSKVPFFTGDSTTWLVGTQYGELNWFDGRKMRRLKKDKWKFEYKQKYISIGANWDLAGQENPYELIRINLIVFRQAEEYIRKRIRGKSYWFDKAPVKKTTLRIKKKPKVIEQPEVKEEIKEVAEVNSEVPKTKFEEFQSLQEEVELRDIDEQVDLLPDLEWFDTEMEDWREYVKALGLNTNGNDKEDILDVLYNLCIFTRDVEVLDDLEDATLIKVAKEYAGKDCEEVDEAIEVIKEVVEKNLTLESNSLFPKGTGTMNMEAPPRPIERDEYLEDDIVELVDVTEEEMKTYLPAPREDGSMPEVDELDAELAKGGIIAVRDEKGRFLKGQKQVRKPKQVWSEKFPKLACNTCYKAGDCPEFKPDHACAYDKIFKKFKTRNMDDLIDAMHGMADLNMERMMRLAMFETMDGGMTDGTLTAMIDQNLNIMTKMKQLHEQKAQIIATQRRTQYADGREDVETTINNPSGGILAQIFGTPSNDSREMEEDRKIIDVEAEEL